MSSSVIDFGSDPDALGMSRHPEGGWYRETWRHETTVSTPRGDRALATCVAFLLRPGERSAWHRVQSSELWLWQGGGPMLLTVGGFDDTPVAGFACELREGGQYVVRAGEWQSAEPATDRPSLVACIVSPGFDFADFSLAE
ncbi:MAG TPA: cupin domain-containing protein [Jatrophihabitantaceae bacterium]|jgi:predicted cupin superfamily sugar epimerase|nr:cupin domain-containing protein [Jatrophihabitantaceae bacterium]